MDEDALAAAQIAVVEERLPGGEPRDRQAGGNGVVDVGSEGSEVARFYGDVFGEGAVSGPVRQSEDALADGHARGAVAELGDDAGELVTGNARRPISARLVGPGAGPAELAWSESGGVHPHEGVVLREPRLGHLHQRHAGDAGVAARDGDCPHGSPSSSESGRDEDTSVDLAAG